MSKYAFDIKNSKDFFEKLKLDYLDFQKDILSSRLAINCALTAWHLTDWIYEEYKDRLGFNNIGVFRKSLNCDSLLLMHDIANGSKHFEINRPKSNISNTNLHKGGFSRDFSFDFDVSCLIIKLDSDVEKYFETEIESVIEFWKSYFEEILDKFNNPSPSIGEV
ncbi:MAG: hypothetical protein AB7S48_15955 [Bacteroidales bacterium]